MATVLVSAIKIAVGDMCSLVEALYPRLFVPISRWRFCVVDDCPAPAGSAMPAPSERRTDETAAIAAMRVEIIAASLNCMKLLGHLQQRFHRPALECRFSEFAYAMMPRACAAGSLRGAQWIAEHYRPGSSSTTWWGVGSAYDSFCSEFRRPAWEWLLSIDSYRIPAGFWISTAREACLRGDEAIFRAMTSRDGCAELGRVVARSCSCVGLGLGDDTIYRHAHAHHFYVELLICACAGRSAAIVDVLCASFGMFSPRAAPGSPAGRAEQLEAISRMCLCDLPGAAAGAAWAVEHWQIGRGDKAEMLARLRQWMIECKIDGSVDPGAYGAVARAVGLSQEDALVLLASGDCRDARTIGIRMWLNTTLFPQNRRKLS